MNKALIPIIRKLMPTTIAQQIVGVQPMPSSAFNTFSFDGSNRKDEMTTGEDFTYEQAYWAQPDLGGPYSLRQERYKEIHEWAGNTFGKHTKEWNNPRWSASDRKYWFKHEKDRLLFVLKWS